MSTSWSSKAITALTDVIVAYILTLLIAGASVVALTGILGNVTSRPSPAWVTDAHWSVVRFMASAITIACTWVSTCAALHWVGTRGSYKNI